MSTDPLLDAGCLSRDATSNRKVTVKCHAGVSPSRHRLQLDRTEIAYTR